MGDRDLTRTTLAERSVLLRHRLGLSQAAWAKRHRTYKWAVQRWEHELAGARCPLGRGRLVEVELLRPTTGEECYLARRRSGVRQRGLASSLSVCHVTLLAWENAGDPRLVRYWERQNYLFTTAS